MPRGRKAGSKNKPKVLLDKKGNEKSNSKAVGKFVKAKKVISNSTVEKDIKEAIKIKGKPKGRNYNHVLWLTDGLYITCDSLQFIIKKVNKKKDKQGNKLSDISLLYARNLNQILKVAVNHGIHVPETYDEIIKHIDHVYGLIDARIPADISPKDLFSDMGDAE